MAGGRARAWNGAWHLLVISFACIFSGHNFGGHLPHHLMRYSAEAEAAAEAP